MIAFTKVLAHYKIDQNLLLICSALELPLLKLIIYSKCLNHLHQGSFVFFVAVVLKPENQGVEKES